MGKYSVRYIIISLLIIVYLPLVGSAEYNNLTLTKTNKVVAASFSKIAQELQSKGDFLGSVTYLQMAVDANPNSYIYREWLADTYLIVGDQLSLLLAVDEYQRVIAIYPRYHSYAGLQKAAMLAGEPLTALTATEKLFSFRKAGDLTYLADLGLLYILLDEPDRGIQYFIKQIQKGNDQSVIKLTMAGIYEYQNNYQQSGLLAKQVITTLGQDDPLIIIAKQIIERSKQ